MNNFIFAFILWANPLSIDNVDSKFYGSTEYYADTNHGITTNLNGEYKIFIYESPKYPWALSLNGKISVDIDHLGNEIKTNVFTTIGIDF